MFTESGPFLAGVTRNQTVFVICVVGGWGGQARFDGGVSGSSLVPATVASASLAVSWVSSGRVVGAVYASLAGAAADAPGAATRHPASRRTQRCASRTETTPVAAARPEFQSS